MSRIIEYAVVIGEDTHGLVAKMSEKIKEGWRPAGSLVVRGELLLQPIVCRLKPGKRIRKTLRNN